LADQDDFESMMNSMGVAKLGGKGGPKRKAPPVRQPPAMPARRPAFEDPQIVLAKLRGEVARLNDALANANAATAAATAGHGAATTAAAAARAESAALLARAEAAEAQVVALTADVDRLDQERRGLQRKLADAEPEEVEAIAAADVFADRGLEPGDEQQQALAELAVQRPGAVLAALALADPEPLADLLHRRVVLAGPNARLGSRDDCVVVRVSSDRCEFGGDSDVESAWRTFATACDGAGIRAATIVGGSPTYRKKIKELTTATGVGPKLKLVSGTQRRPKHKAEADLRTSDLVLVWGGTELDHSVSGPYTDARDPKVLIIAHRGISGMLDRARQQIDRWARL